MLLSESYQRSNVIVRLDTGSKTPMLLLVIGVSWPPFGAPLYLGVTFTHRLGVMENGSPSRGSLSLPLDAEALNMIGLPLSEPELTLTVLIPSAAPNVSRL